MIKQIQDVAIEYNIDILHIDILHIDILHIDILHIQTICELIYWLFKETSYLYLVYQNDSSFPLFPVSFDTLLKDIDYLNLYYSKCDNVIRDIICDNFLHQI